MDWNEKIFDFYKNVKTIRTVSKLNQVKKPYLYLFNRQ